MKLLHSADWHLDAPMLGKTPEQTAYLRQELLKIPETVTSLCREQGCDVLLLSGDLFDGAYSKESYLTVYRALENVKIPVNNYAVANQSSPQLLLRGAKRCGNLASSPYTILG